MDQDIDTIEQSFEDIPEEVKHYIYSSAFVGSFNNLCREQDIVGSEQQKLKSAIYSYVAQVDTEEDLVACINSISKSPDSNQTILNWVSENVTEKILSMVTDAYVEAETSGEIQEQIAPSPIQALTSIRERLSQSSNIASTKRDYSVERPETPSSSPTTPKPVFDIYREPPTK